jgi:hypothetical protein
MDGAGTYTDLRFTPDTADVESLASSLRCSMNASPLGGSSASTGMGAGLSLRSKKT